MSILDLILWVACFAAVFLLFIWIDRVDRATIGAARFESPEYQRERGLAFIAVNLFVLGVLLTEWLATWVRNRGRHCQGLPPMSMRQRGEPVLVVLFIVGIWVSGLILAHGLKIVVFNDPPTRAAYRIAIGLVVTVLFGIPFFNLAMVVLVWSLVPFLWAWYKLSGSGADEDVPPRAGSS